MANTMAKTVLIFLGYLLLLLCLVDYFLEGDFNWDYMIMAGLHWIWADVHEILELIKEKVRND